MTNGDSENLVEAISQRVREALLEAEKRGNEFVEEAERRATEIIAEAEERAARIVADADMKAERTVTHAEDQARDRVDRARKALEELGVALSSAADEVEPPSEPEAHEFDDREEEVPALEEPEDEADEEPEPEEPEEEYEEPAAEEPEEPEPEEPAEASAASPTTDELIAQLRSGAGEAAADTGGDAAARLVAMNMALEGVSRDEVERHLADGYEVADREALLDEVFARVGG